MSKWTYAANMSFSHSTKRNLRLSLVFSLETVKFSWISFIFPSVLSPFPLLLFTYLGTSSHLCKTHSSLHNITSEAVPKLSHSVNMSCLRIILRERLKKSLMGKRCTAYSWWASWEGKWKPSRNTEFSDPYFIPAQHPSCSQQQRSTVMDKTSQ